jgi:lauroyl/myristoyl acyltransferase
MATGTLTRRRRRRAATTRGRSAIADPGDGARPGETCVSLGDTTARVARLQLPTGAFSSRIYCTLVRVLKDHHEFPEIQQIAQLWFVRYNEWRARCQHAQPLAIIAEKADDDAGLRRPAEHRGQVQFRGERDLDEVLTARRGALVVGFHTATAYLLGDALSSRGVTASYVVEDDREARRLALVLGRSRQTTEDERLRPGVECVSASGVNAASEVFVRLRKNQVVILLLDRLPGFGNGPEKGKDVTFLGLPLRIRTTFAELAHRAQAPLIPLYSYRDEADRPVFEMRAPIFPDTSSKKDAWMDELVCRVFGALEAFVLQYPHECCSFFSTKLPLLEEIRLPKDLTDEEVFLKTEPWLVHLLDLNGTPMLVCLNDKKVYRPSKATVRVLELLYAGDTLGNILEHARSPTEEEQFKWELESFNHLGVYLD